MLGRAFLTLCFFLFLYPISVDGLSVNYSFVLLPLALVLARGKVQHPGDGVLFAAAIFMLIFFAATLYQFASLDDVGRRAVSFAIFMSIFCFAFVKVDDETVAAFKDALVAISLFFSLKSIYILLSIGAVNLGYEAKNVVGSQRFGFIYLVAIWLVYLDPQIRRTYGPLRYPILLVLMGGLLLTFSRSSIVSLLAAALLFGLSRVGGWFKVFSLRGLLAGCATIVGAVVVVLVLYRTFPLAFDFFGEQLFGFFANRDAVTSHLGDAGTSEGIRMRLIAQVLDYVSHNPLTGAGYLGVWVMPDAAEKSAHNQYMDVLFRTGLPGFFCYIGILIGIMLHLLRREQALFWGVLSVLVYGFFHETFKESQGAFVLAFLFGMAAQAWRARRAQAARGAEPTPLAAH